MVVEKLDKPKTSSAYEIQQAPKSGDDRERRQQKDQSEKDEFSASSGIQGWQKFHTTATNRKPLKLRRQDIEHLWFRQVTLQKGIIIIELDVGLRNNQILKAVHTFLTRLDDYWKLKAFIPGQEIPVHEIVREPTIEVSVLQREGIQEIDRTAIATPVKMKTQTSFWKLTETKTGRLNSKAVIFYAVLAAILILLIFIML